MFAFGRKSVEIKGLFENCFLNQFYIFQDKKHKKTYLVRVFFFFLFSILKNKKYRIFKKHILIIIIFFFTYVMRTILRNNNTNMYI